METRGYCNLVLKSSNECLLMEFHVRIMASDVASSNREEKHKLQSCLCGGAILAF